MKITKCSTTIVTVPYRKPYRWRIAECHGITAVITELHTDNGLVGIGESPCLFPTAEAFKALIDECAPLAIGEDPFDHERIYKRMLGLRGLYYDRVFAGLALSGLDLALWDLMGKAAQQPLYKLIGGSVHSRASFVCILPLHAPESIGQDAQKAVADGCRTLYLKYDDSEKEFIGRLDAIRKAVGPDIRIRVDFNQALSPGYAIKFIRELERFDLEGIEQPCGEEDLDGMRYIRQGVRTPIISDESSKTFLHAFNTIRSQSADVIEVDPYSSDGIWGVRKICGMAEAAGLPVVFHSIGELGLNLMKAVHLAVSTPNATLDHQTLYDYNGDDVIAGGLLNLRSWSMEPSDKPGLGVDLDPEKVQKYAQVYRTKGPLYLTRSANTVTTDAVPLISSQAARQQN